MRRAWPDPVCHFKYRSKPKSGNEINGLGETVKRRPVQIFHSSGFRKVEWHALELFFLMTMPLRLFIKGMGSRLLLRKGDGAVARNCIEVTDPGAMSSQIKQVARRFGADAVGITTFTEEAQFEHIKQPYKYAISIACGMDFDLMEEHVTDPEGGLETLRVYTAITHTVIRLAAHIRKLGWPARAYCESADILHIPIAIQAGLGELGKHGSLINRELGANLRLATVLTDLPLAVDSPVDIAVEDLCLTCRRCTKDCPVDAISDTRQLVRGVEKWYVDFDKCVPYFSKTYGCGICIQVCPWSKPGKGPGLSEKLLSNRISGLH